MIQLMITTRCRRQSFQLCEVSKCHGRNGTRENLSHLFLGFFEAFEMTVKLSFILCTGIPNLKEQSTGILSQGSKVLCSKLSWNLQTVGMGTWSTQQLALSLIIVMKVMSTTTCTHGSVASEYVGGRRGGPRRNAKLIRTEQKDISWARSFIVVAV